MSQTLDVTVIGGGMITADVILPTLYHLQRTGSIGSIDIVGRSPGPLKELRDDPELAEAFPGQQFTAHPSLDAGEVDKSKNDNLYREVVGRMKKHQVVIVALPDQLHYSVVKDLLMMDQHVLCVKPFVLEYKQGVELKKLAHERGLFVGVEYHKRFDRRSLIARRDHRMGKFGQFAIGEARLIEPAFYRRSNFQNWFTPDNTDPFVYIGCHYVDLVHFVTGLLPTAVSVDGVKHPFPNGNDAWMWSLARVRFENGGLLSVLNGLGYPDLGGGSNDQGITLYFESGNGEDTGMIAHNDQFRGVAHAYTDADREKRYHYINPDFFRYTPWEGEGSKPIGYGYDSVATNVEAMVHIEEKTAGLGEPEALVARRKYIEAIDEEGLIATPANSSYNELVHEAARASIQDGGRNISIVYGDDPHIEA